MNCYKFQSKVSQPAECPIPCHFATKRTFANQARRLNLDSHGQLRMTYHCATKSSSCRAYLVFTWRGNERVQSLIFCVPLHLAGTTLFSATECWDLNLLDNVKLASREGGKGGSFFRLQRCSYAHGSSLSCNSIFCLTTCKCARIGDRRALIMPLELNFMHGY